MFVIWTEYNGNAEFFKYYPIRKLKKAVGFYIVIFHLLVWVFLLPFEYKMKFGNVIKDSRKLELTKKFFFGK